MNRCFNSDEMEKQARRISYVLIPTMRMAAVLSDGCLSLSLSLLCVCVCVCGDVCLCGVRLCVVDVIFLRSLVFLSPRRL
jgi:hypothetical protein